MFRISIVISLTLAVLSGDMGQAQEWLEITPSTGGSPAPRRNAAAIYDPQAQRMILFAGKGAAGDFNDVWQFDLDAELWSEITPASGPAPAPRFTPNAVYDPVGQQMIIWSGQGASFYNDVWAFDLATGTWAEYLPPDPKPNIRYGTAAVFDPLARNLVTFAGFTNQGRFDDTWRFDVDNAVWTNVTPPQGNPLERCLHSASYDSANHRMIIYGGQQSGPLGDIWAFDLGQNSWTELTPPNSPPGRYFAANIYEPLNHRTVIFGGNRGSSGGMTNEVWAFNLALNTWQQLMPSGTPPQEREGAAAIYIRSQDRMVVFGGRGASFNLLNDVWTLNGLSEPTGIRGHVPGEAVAGFSLHQNYPNPFNPATKISFTLPAAAQVTVKVYNLLGQEVKTLLSGFLSPGKHEAEWNGTDGSNFEVPSGIYLYRLETRYFSESGKMVLIR